MKIYSVQQVNRYIKNLISNDYLLKNISIKGEISNCKYHSMGHIYFTLKDESGSMSAVMFKDSTKNLSFKLSEGQSVVVKGNIDVYERDGKYQLYAKEILLDGTGRLYDEFLRLKHKLYEEGLFEFDTKKEIPKFPKTIGIVTASTGAAIQDIINIAKRRNPYVQLILYPAKVQGEGAAATIVKGIKMLDNMGVDTIIIGRGGGSIEDLWPFNEENVARAIFEANTPIISGTGHEIDNTIADYVADLRAPTPSAACEIAVPDVMLHIRELDNYKNRFNNIILSSINLNKMQLENLSNRLNRLNPVNTINQHKQYLADLYDKMNNSIIKNYRDKTHMLELIIARLNGLSPTAKLINGYGYISKKNDPIKNVYQLKKDDTINITINDGVIEAKVIEIRRQND